MSYEQYRREQPPSLSQSCMNNPRDLLLEPRNVGKKIFVRQSGVFKCLGELGAKLPGRKFHQFVSQNGSNNSSL